MNKKKLFTRKRVTGAVSVLLIALLLLGGTSLAWQSISQLAINNADGQPLPAGGRLHDDFQDDQDWAAGANKDVYVENYGDRPIFVRVRVSEYMEIGVGAGKFSYTPDTDGYNDLDKAGRIADPDNHATPLIDGADITDPSTWEIHIPKEYTAPDSADGFHHYWSWQMGGSKIFMPTFNKNNESLKTDRTEYAHNEFAAGDLQTDDAAYWDKENDTVETKTETHTAKPTLSGNVMTLKQWIDAGRPVGNFWVYDTDGWAYWGQALLPEDATALLLSGVTLENEPDEEWYYATHVMAQMATAGDWGSADEATGFYTDGITNEALFLLSQAAGRLPEVTDLYFPQGGTIFVQAGVATTITPTVILKNSVDPNDQAVTWTIDPYTPVFIGGTITPLEDDAGRIYTVTATSKHDPEFSASIQVVVYPIGGSVVVGGDNKTYYVEYPDNTFKEIKGDGTFGPLLCGGLDEIPGTADDRFDIVVSQPSGNKFLGPNADGSYWAPGDDGKLGTADDTKVWPDPTLETPTTLNPNDVRADNILILVVGGGAVEVVKGDSIQFSTQVELSGTAIANQNVTWSIVSAVSSGTTITPTTATTGNVTLTVAAGETHGTITLRATAQEDTKVYKNVTVAIKPSPASGVAVGQFFTDKAGIEWLVLADDSQGHKLIITRYVYGLTAGGNGGPGYHSNNFFLLYDNPFYEFTLKPAMDSWYYSRVTTDIKVSAFAYNYQTETGGTITKGKIGAGIEYDFGINDEEIYYWESSYNLLRAKTRAGNQSSPAVFPLSSSEVNAYFADGSNRRAYNANATSTACAWWLRSPGRNATNSIAIVSSVGVLSSNNATDTTIGYRPALWVKA